MARGRDFDDLEANPLTAHLLAWFTELSEERKYLVIAGMGGGACLPEAISSSCILSWCQLTGNEITPWEAETLKVMDRAWRQAYGQKQGGSRAPAAQRQHQGLGDYCNGSKIDECRKLFGAQLEMLCATCPD